MQTYIGLLKNARWDKSQTLSKIRVQIFVKPTKLSAAPPADADFVTTGEKKYL